MMTRPQCQRPNIWVFATVAATAAVLTLLCFLNYRQIKALSIVKPSDFILNHETLASTAQGRCFETTLLNGAGLGNADHFPPTSCLLAPAFWLSDSVYVTHYLVPVIVLLPVIPIFLLSRQLMKSAFFGFCGAVTYLLLPETHALAINGLWMGMLEIPLLATMVLFFRRGNRGWFSVFALLTMMCREEYLIIVGLFAVTELLTARRRSFLTIPIVLAVCYGSFLWSVTRTISEDRVGTTVWFLKNGALPLGEILADSARLSVRLSPVLLLSLLSPARLLPVMPAYLTAAALVNLTAPEALLSFQPGDPNSHYIMTLFALVVMTSLESAAWLVKRLGLDKTSRRTLLGAVLVLGWCGQIWTSYQRFAALGADFFTPTQVDNALWRRIESVPSGVRLVSNVNVPYLFIDKAELFLRLNQDDFCAQYLVVMDHMFDREFLDNPTSQHELYEGIHIDWDRLGIMVRPNAFGGGALKRIFTPLSPSGLILSASDCGANRFLIAGGLSASRTEFSYYRLAKRWEFARLKQEHSVQGFVTLNSDAILTQDVTLLGEWLLTLVTTLPPAPEALHTNVSILPSATGSIHAVILRPGALNFWVAYDVGPTAGELQTVAGECPITAAVPYHNQLQEAMEVIYACENNLYAYQTLNPDSQLLLSLDQPIVSLAIAPVTADHRPFIVAAENTGRVYLIDRASLEKQVLNPETSSQSYITAIESADVDNDQDEDLLLYDLSTFSVQVWNNNSDGSFTYNQSLLMGPLSRFLKVADLDRDGLLDLVTSKSCFLISASELAAYLRCCRIDAALVDVSNSKLSEWLHQLGWQRTPIAGSLFWYHQPEVSNQEQ